MSEDELLQLCDELRVYLLYSAGVSGGHFGANLGVVELTVALHTLLNTPDDRLVWDVGHQAYAHKVLTGRREQLPSIRKHGGLTAFPERAESEYDTFGVGHSSTSISAALGMALALRQQADTRKVACVIGDGAMTAGMVFEAINDAVYHNANMLIVLNDNDMSISCSTGGFAQHLSALWHSGCQVDITQAGTPTLKPFSNSSFASRNLAKRASTKHASAKPSSTLEYNLFSVMGLHYFGPFDGHNLPELLRVLNAALQVQGPKLVHIYTTKGKGFAPAEADPVGYHAISKLSQSQQPAQPKAYPHAKKYSAVFGEFLCDAAMQDHRLMAITPAMCEGSGMVKFAAKYPKRFFDVAIAEQHAVTLAAGMACEGAKPIVAIYSTFLQRGYDQLIHDVALQNLDVTFAIDRAGLVGEDGATHAGVFDYAYMRCLPNVVLCAPKDENECYAMLQTAYEYKGVAAVRYPRGLGVGAVIEKPAHILSIGKAEIVYETKPTNVDKSCKPTDRAERHDSLANNVHQPVALLAFGSMVAPSVLVAKKLVQDGFKVMVVNMRFIKPLDTQLIQKLVQRYALVTLEEHVVMAGAGSAVNEFLMSLKRPTSKNKVLNLGIPDRYIAHGSHAEQLRDCGLDVDGIYQSVMDFLATELVI